MPFTGCIKSSIIYLLFDFCTFTHLRFEVIMADFVYFALLVVFSYFLVAVIAIQGFMYSFRPVGPIQAYIWNHTLISMLMWPVMLILWPFSFFWAKQLPYDEAYVLVGASDGDYVDVPSKRKLKRDNPRLYRKVVREQSKKE